MVDTKLYLGDCLDILPTLEAGSVHCCVTSPPYWGLRDYGTPGQLGLERSPDEYVAKLVQVFREVRRVLRDDGTLWLNLGDSYASGKGSCFNPGGGESSYKDYRKECGVIPLQRLNKSEVIAAGMKPKDLVGIPWMVAFALRADGWYLRSDVIWSKPNPMPESVRDRPTKAHEYLFLLAKSERYYYDYKAIKEPQKTPSGDKSHHSFGTKGGKVEFTPGKTRKESGKKWANNGDGRRRRTVWTIPTRPYKGAHFAVFPSALVEPCIKAGCPIGGTVLDPFTGSGTTGAVALELDRNFIGIEMNPNYLELINERISKVQLCLTILTPRN